MIRQADDNCESEPDWERLIERYSPAMYRLAAKLNYHGDTADEIVHRAWLRCWKKWRNESSLQPTQALLRQMVQWESVDYMREQYGRHTRKLREVPNEHLYSKQGEPSYREGEHRHLYETLDRMPWRLATILRMQMQGYLQEEMAERIGVCPALVSRLMVRAKTRLRELYGRE